MPEFAATGCAGRSVKSFAGYAGIAGGCAKSERYWQRQRPGSRGRLDPEGLRVHERESGAFPRRRDGPRARCLPERVVRVASSSAVGSDVGRCRARDSGPGDSSSQPRDVWCPADSRRANRLRCRRAGLRARCEAPEEFAIFDAGGNPRKANVRGHCLHQSRATPPLHQAANSGVSAPASKAPQLPCARPHRSPSFASPCGSFEAPRTSTSCFPAASSPYIHLPDDRQRRHIAPSLHLVNPRLLDNRSTGRSTAQQCGPQRPPESDR